MIRSWYRITSRIRLSDGSSVETTGPLWPPSANPSAVDRSNPPVLRPELWQAWHLLAKTGRTRFSKNSVASVSGAASDETEAEKPRSTERNTRMRVAGKYTKFREIRCSGNCGRLPAARGKSRHGIRPGLHPGGLRCSSVTYPSERLVRRAQPRSRCSRDFSHGLLDSWVDEARSGNRNHRFGIHGEDPCRGGLCGAGVQAGRGHRRPPGRRPGRTVRNRQGTGRGAPGSPSRGGCRHRHHSPPCPRPRCPGLHRRGKARAGGETPGHLRVRLRPHDRRGAPPVRDLGRGLPSTVSQEQRGGPEADSGGGHRPDPDHPGHHVDRGLPAGRRRMGMVGRSGQPGPRSELGAARHRPAPLVHGDGGRHRDRPIPQFSDPGTQWKARRWRC